MSRPVIVGAALFVVVAACGGGEQPRYPVTFNASSDRDVPLAGVQIAFRDTPLGITDALGKLRVQMFGREGASLQFDVRCPEGHRNPAPTRSISLTRVVGLDPATQAAGLQVSISCPPERRLAAVVVRAAGFADLPVLLDDEVVARTDTSGVAHIAREFAPDTTFQMHLDTTSRPLMRPQNPVQTFTTEDKDDLFVFDQQLEEETPRRHVTHRRRRRAPAAAAPVRLPVRIE